MPNFTHPAFQPFTVQHSLYVLLVIKFPLTLPYAFPICMLPIPSFLPSILVHPVLYTLYSVHVRRGLASDQHLQSSTATYISNFSFLIRAKINWMVRANSAIENYFKQLLLKRRPANFFSHFYALPANIARKNHAKIVVTIII